jgi:hypothetical protein
MRPFRLAGLFAAVLLLIGCTVFMPLTDFARLYGPSNTPNRQIDQQQYAREMAEGKVSFLRDVQPILDNRCVACHGCYDAPCQLKLESAQGLDRGASKTLVYDGARLKAMAPTRLFVDAKTTVEWRNKGFAPVLNERSATADAALENSVLAKMLLLKQNHPLPTTGILPDDFEFALDRPLECPRSEEFNRYAAQHPLWGMPYALPGLSDGERTTILNWLAQGAHYPAPDPVAARSQPAIDRWEAFMNGQGLKQRLVARYVYEHLFMGHLYFKGATDRAFYRLTRSATPPGQPAREIPTTRPYDDPGRAFYYRLVPVRQTLVDKNHLPYEIGDARIARLRELFLEPDYSVSQWPGYARDVAANPFVVFDALPPQSRYRFMLDDAYFFISGFMKGPVCRGQVALNVIRDQFWIFFYDPATDAISNDAAFLRAQAQQLELPSEKGDDIGMGDMMVGYTERQVSYLKEKNNYLVALKGNVRNSAEALWTGDGHNPSAALTAFRHFDSASLSYGLIGELPQTAWLVDYPLFERIHYLLVAGFNVFGSVSHQAATRLYMDNLRMEGENNMLSLVPAAARPSIYRNWNQGYLSELNSAVVNPYYGYGKDSAVPYQSSHYKQELFTLITARLGAMAGPADAINRCGQPPCHRPGASALERRADDVLRALSLLQGGGIQYLPDVSFIRVHEAGAASDRGVAYSLVKNIALENVSFMMLENSRRLPENDTLTLAPGFVGSYPHLFFDVDISRLPAFVERILAIGSPEEATRLVDEFGIRRGNPAFWQFADFFNRENRRLNPVAAGLFDLNRYDNR